MNAHTRTILSGVQTLLEAGTKAGGVATHVTVKFTEMAHGRKDLASHYISFNTDGAALSNYTVAPVGYRTAAEQSKVLGALKSAAATMAARYEAEQNRLQHPNAIDISDYLNNAGEDTYNIDYGSLEGLLEDIFGARSFTSLAYDHDWRQGQTAHYYTETPDDVLLAIDDPKEVLKHIDATGYLNTVLGWAAAKSYIPEGEYEVVIDW